MGKSKEIKSASKAKTEVATLKSVKNASVTKSSQKPAAKAKATAKETAAKVSKKSKKAATPSSDSEDDSASDSSDSESEEEAPAKKTNGKVNGKTNGAAKKVEAESSDESSDSSEDEKKPVAATEDSGDSDSSDSDEEAAPVAAVAKKVVDAGKAAVNGAAKAVAKATVSVLFTHQHISTANDQQEDSSDSSDSSNDDSDSESSDSDSDDAAEAPSKKRKASEEAEPATKKAKTDSATNDTGSKNLFIGNLSWNVDDEWLLQEFKEFGEITGARVISDKATGRSKGFGYVEFANSADAAKALEAKKGALIDGREANVDFSTPRDENKPRERAQGRAQQYGDQSNPPSDTLFLGNLSFDADENVVGEAFGAHGTVVNVRLPTDQ